MITISLKNKYRYQKSFHMDSKILNSTNTTNRNAKLPQKIFLDMFTRAVPTVDI